MNLRRRFIVIVGSVVFLSIRALASPTVPLATVGQCEETPKIDGKIDDATWRTSAQLFPFIEANGTGLAKAPSRVLLAYNATDLFIAFRCNEPDMKALVAGCRSHDSSVWRDDCIEVFLRPGGTGPIYHIIVNSIGTVYDDRDGAPSWNANLRAVAARGEKSWTVELAIPWAEIGGPPRKGDVWRANFCRERKVQSELSCWSCTHGSFLKPERFGEIVFTSEAVRLERLDLSDPTPGANRAAVAFSAPKGKQLSVKAQNASPVPCPTQATKPTALLYPLGLDENGISIEASLGNRVVWRFVGPARIEPPPALGRLHRAISSTKQAIARLDAKAPLRAALQKAIAEARTDANHLENAIEKSVKDKKPLPHRQYARLNSAVASAAQKLESLRWPVWTKNNWENVLRDELPPSAESVTHADVTTCVNEYESANLIVSNVGSEPLRLRVTASDLVWMNDIPDSARNILRNGSLDADKNKDGIPDGWRPINGNHSVWKLVPDKGRGRAIEIELAKVDRTTTLRQDISLTPGKDYTLEFRARTENATPGTRVHVINQGWTWGPGSPPLQGTRDWHRVRFTFRPRESPVYQVVLFAGGKGKGKIWLDDFVLVEGASYSTPFTGTAPRLFVADWQELRSGATVADPLIPLNPAGRLDVPAGESRQVWIEFPARDLPPGKYQCSIGFQPLATYAHHGAPDGKTVRFDIKVVPLRLRTSPDFAVYNWDYAKNESYVKDLLAHKVNFFLISTGMPLPPFAPDGTPRGTMDFSSYDRMLRIKINYARKAHGQILFAYGIIRDFHYAVKKRYGWKFRDAAWDKAFRFAYGQWLKHIKAMGLKYDEFCVQVWDEASGGNVDYVVEGSKLLREIDPKVRLVMDGAQSLKEIKRMDPYIDVWIPHLSKLLRSEERRELLAYYKNTGEPVYCYTCRTQMKAQPAYEYYRLKPWYAASLGLDGVFYWAYNSWRGDPWNDFDGPIADCGVVYPGADGPITSRRWEASREGIEDWQIMRLVERLATGRSERQKVKQVVDDSIRSVLKRPDHPGLADHNRLKLIELGGRLASHAPLRIMNVHQEVKGSELNVRFRSNRPSSAKIYYRWVGDDVWHTQVLPSALAHSATIYLPVAAKAQWVIVAWDSEGRVAFGRSTSTGLDK